MKNQLALTISGYGQINPKGVPSGNISGQVVANGIILLMVFAAILTLFYLLWAGINWVMSEGDKAKITQARNKITYAIIGLVLIFLSFFIAMTTARFFGLSKF
jgi:bacteriorhodopsin